MLPSRGSIEPVDRSSFHQWRLQALLQPQHYTHTVQSSTEFLAGIATVVGPSVVLSAALAHCIRESIWAQWPVDSNCSIVKLGIDAPNVSSSISPMQLGRCVSKCCRSMCSTSATCVMPSYAQCVWHMSHALSLCRYCIAEQGVKFDCCSLCVPALLRLHIAARLRQFPPLCASL
jgi:hypothetical protein